MTYHEEILLSVLEQLVDDIEQHNSLESVYENAKETINQVKGLN